MTILYLLREKDGEVVQCDSCHSDAPTGEFEWFHAHPRCGEGKRLLCEFCSVSMTSRYTEYPATNATDLFGALRAEIWTAAANVFNMLKHGGSK